MGLQSRHPLLAFIFFWFVLPPTHHARTPHPCYFAANQIGSDNWMPCYGSVYSEHYSCCRAGDNCVDGNACWDQETTVTYQYGCTDAGYMDPHCPKKCGLPTGRSQWVGMVLCNGTDGQPKDQWICNHPDNRNIRNCTDRAWDEDLQVIPQTWCEDLRHDWPMVALNATSVLAGIASLPAATNTSAFWAEHTDRYKDVALDTAGGLAPTSTNTRSANDVSSDKSAMTIGLAVGLGVGIPLLIGVTAFTFFCIRRRRKGKEDDASAGIPARPIPHAPAHHDDKKDAQESQGFKAELDGTPDISSPGPSEMQDTSVMGSPYGSPYLSPGARHDGFKGDGISRCEGGGKVGGQAHEMAG